LRIRYQKLLVPLLAALLLAESLAPCTYAHAAEERDQFDLMTMFLAALVLTDAPLNNVEKYELFHTVVINQSGSLELRNEPYIPADVLLNLTKMAYEGRKAFENGTITYSLAERNDSILAEIREGDSLLENITFYPSGDRGWDFHFEELYNVTIDSNTVLTYGNVVANVSNTMKNYRLLYYVSNISNTHKLYIVTIAEINDSEYSKVLTIATYHFKEKKVFFGDWILLPYGAPSLSDYYITIANTLKWLHENVYEKSDSNYKPQAYPLIADHIQKLANSLPAEVNLRVVRGYALALDFLMSIIKGAVVGAVMYTVNWAVTTGCDVNKWSWRDFGISVAFGAISFTVGGGVGKVLEKVKWFAKLPRWARW